ncbi:transposase [Streptococcus acidominimus]|uniref:Transposase n=1 Tax=Streptococcus acidominimus TaxID=1326 RepID=A0A239X4C0_STRAI|nr:transposase [Streptococcus acidominimus]
MMNKLKKKPFSELLGGFLNDLIHLKNISSNQDVVKSMLLGLSLLYLLFPLNGCRWFTGDIVDDTVDVLNFINNTS